MEHNGNGHEPGSFEWLLSARLRSYGASGASPDDLETLKSRGAAMAAVLEEFRSKRRQLGDSGRFTQQGLREALGELAAAAKGKILHEQDGSILAKQIQQLEQKLATPTPVEKDDRLLNYWKQMEIMATYDRMGLTLVDPVAGTVRYDTVRADQLYRQSLERGEDTAMLALEGWPGGSPVSPDLIERGKRQRMLAKDPVLAGQLTEAIRFQEVWSETVSDALAELREHLPADDVVARQASGQADGTSAT